MLVYLVLVGFVNHYMWVAFSQAPVRPRGQVARIQSHDDMLSQVEAIRWPG